MRGAPAIGVTAAWGCVLALHGLPPGADWPARLDAALEALAQARPTAVNLRWAVERLRALWRRLGPETGREALLAAFMALGLKRGDEVIVPSFTYPPVGPWATTARLCWRTATPC